MTVVIDAYKNKSQTYQSGGRDSLVKVIDTYFACITAETFTFGDKTYRPRDLRISPDLIRGMICYENCGACCRDFTLDFLPQEKAPYDIISRQVSFNGKQFEIMTDFNDLGIVDKFGVVRCKNLKDNGRCGIHMKHPFSCDFELLRFVQPNNKERSGITKFNHQLFGRGWQMKRVTDGERGALCEMTGRTEEDRQDVIRKLTRLKDWTDYFELNTVLPEIINWCKNVSLNNEDALFIYQVDKPLSVYEFV